MSNLYNLTKSIHNEVERINPKLGLEIEIESDYFLIDYENGEIGKFGESEIKIIAQKFESLGAGKCEYIPAIQAPQIRQILVGLKEVLKTEIKYDSMFGDMWITNPNTANNLCQKWLDGLEPLFDREPENVLNELLEILKNI